jgi:DNA-binding IclR family transcriptional regulator
MDEPRTRLKLASLWSPTRLAMLDAVHANPGAWMTDVARAISRHPSVVWTSVHLLLRAGLIRRERDGRSVRLWPVSGHSARDLFLARLGPSAPVYEALASGVPGRPVPLAHACGITRHAARYHLTRLTRLGAIRSVETRVLVTERRYLVVEA